MEAVRIAAAVLDITNGCIYVLYATALNIVKCHVYLPAFQTQFGINISERTLPLNSVNF